MFYRFSKYREQLKKCTNRPNSFYLYFSKNILSNKIQCILIKRGRSRSPLLSSCNQLERAKGAKCLKESFKDSFVSVIFLQICSMIKHCNIQGFNEVGGYSNLQTKYMNSVPSVRNENTSCGLPKQDAFHLFLDPVDSDYPWPAIVLMSTIGAVWYWCCDQVLV